MGILISSFLKKNWREAFIVLLIVFCVFAINQCQNNAHEVKMSKVKNDSSYIKLKTFVNKNGDQVTQVKSYELTVNDLKKHGDELGFENSKLKKQVGTLSNLVAYYKAKVSLTDSIKTTVHDTTIVYKGDTLHQQTFTWNNKYMYFNGTIFNKKLNGSYHYNIDFTLAAYRKPGNLWHSLKPAPIVADIHFSDPNIKIQDFKGFVIQEPKKKWFQTKVFTFTAGAIVGGFTVYKVHTILK